MNRHILILLIGLLPILVFSQTPFYQNYSSEEYNAGAQNWATVQDDRGILYFGNNEGVLEFDGRTWRVIKTPTTVRSLAISDSNVIYVGIVSDFGKLVPDSLGFYEYQSIKADFSGLDLEFTDVYRTRIVGSDVFFCAPEKIIKFSQGRIKTFLPKKRFSFSFQIKNDLYVADKEEGILRYNGESFELLEGSELYGQTKVNVLLPYDEDKLLVGADNVGLQVYSISEKRILNSYDQQFENTNLLLNQGRIYCGITLKNGNYLIGTSSTGIFEVSPDGNIIGQYNTKNGLQSNGVYSISYDRDGLLWFALASGISSLNTTLPFTYYSKLNGLNGNVLSMDHDNGVTYIGTDLNGYRLTKDKQIEAIPGTAGQNWYIKSTKSNVLFAHNPKGFLKESKSGVNQLEGAGNMVADGFSDVPNYPNLLLAGAHEGLYVLENISGNWKVRNRINAFDHVVYSFEIDHEGVIWIRCAPDELYRITLNKELDRVESSEKMNTVYYELHNNGLLSPYKLNSGEVIFGSNRGVYQYNKDKKCFQKYGPMNNLDGEVNPIMQAKDGSLWYEESKNGRHYKGVVRLENNEWNNYTTPFLKFSNKEIYKGPSKTIIEDDKGKIYFGTINGLLVYDPSQGTKAKSSYNTSIRSVEVSGSVVDGGHDTGQSILSIPYTNNHLKFEYVGHNYEDNEKVQYAYRLIGRDTSWSQWAPYNQKEYTNLPNDEYQFEVKAKTLLNNESTIASYKFEIQTPWHKTWLAYLFFIGLIFLLLYTVVRYYTARQRKRNKELEKMVFERTTALEEEKDKSENLSENLLKIFSIIGHDLRKPALSFRGITTKINYLLKNKDFEKLDKLGITIEKNANSLMGLTDNLLNWALSEKDLLPHNPSAFSIKEVVEEVCSLVSNLSSDKQISIISEIDQNHTIIADINSVHLILRNLINNALKFTLNGGAIKIISNENGKFIEIHVIDDGIGMEEDQLINIFKLNKTKSRKSTDGESGTGLGLYLVHEMVVLNKGTIAVSSSLQKGSTFTVSLPKQI